MPKHKALSQPHTRIAPEKAAGNLVHLQLGQLKTHPKNMRRFYPVSQVKEMAQSIRDYGGLVQALIVAPDGEPNTYYVVDGNMRLAGGRFLGAACPPLKAEVVSQARAEQMLTMIVANTFRYEVDPVSEALHYRALQDEGLSVAEIAERTGLYYARVKSRLRLLDLDEPIQQLIAEGRLPISERGVEAFLSVPDAAVRVKLAQRLARPGVRLATIEAACVRVAESLEQNAFGSGRGAEAKSTSVSQPASTPERCPRCEMLFTDENPRTENGLCGYCEEEGAPMASLARAANGVASPEPDAPVPLAEIRVAARAMCQTCDIWATALGGEAVEPAWSLLAHAAGETCSNCSLREVQNACSACPGVEVLRRLFARAGVGAPKRLCQHG